MFKEMKMRQLQKRANAFVNSLEGKSDKEVEQAYLDNKEFTNNEIVLSFLFFKHPSLIRILPLDFQKSRINSNLSMFRSGSNEARKSLVSDWIKDNKFFMACQFHPEFKSRPNRIHPLFDEFVKSCINK